MSPIDKGKFIISLDFELFWGIRDKKTLEQYQENIYGAWEVVPKLLNLFTKYQIHATWAVVGAMLSKDENDLNTWLPTVLPQYLDQNLSPYPNYINEFVKPENSKFHHGLALFEMLKTTENQEIGSHSFSHYYALEDGQNKEAFLSDLEASLNIIKSKEVNEICSYVFPRHQINKDYIKYLPKFGIDTYRETEVIWYNNPSKSSKEGVLKRIIRFADYYLWMGSHHTQKLSEVHQLGLYRVRASRWLRPYSDKWKALDFLKIYRVKQQMTYAAKHNELFHLWFHPHDIGKNQEENFDFLEIILKHYLFLKDKYQMESCNMKEIKMGIQNGTN